MRPRLVANTQSGGRSPFDGTEQTLEMPGARWAFDIVFDGLDRAEIGALSAFVFGLQGRAGRFLFDVPLPRRLPWPGAAPVVAGAGQTGRIVNTSGWPANFAAFDVGDWVCWADASGRTALHMVVGNAAAQGQAPVATAAGLCALRVAPALRRPPVNNTAVRGAAPVQGFFRLSTDDAGLDIQGGPFGNCQLSIEEALF